MEKAHWHSLTTEECLTFLEVTPAGLTTTEAKARTERFGENRLNEGESASLLAIFLHQFQDFMVLVLLAATLISGLLGEFMDAITIIAIIFVNGVLGFFQEIRAERSLASLKELTSPTANVLRDGQKITLPASDLVPGDMVYLENGDRIPADIRILKSQGLEAEESSLTGESLPVHKIQDTIVEEDIGIGDRKNMLYMGTMITRGKGYGVVTATGMDTEMGLIADLIQTAEETETPLQRRLEQLGKVLVYVALAITLIVVVTGILHGQNIYNMFLAGVSLAVAAIPEGLPAIVTIALALGVQRMIKRKAIVRKLPSVETLGAATVICSDKTGTLTQNRMTVQKVWAGGQFFDVTGSGEQTVGTFELSGKAIDASRRQDLRRILEIAVACNNALIESSDGDSVLLKGDPTESALLVMGAKAGFHQESLEKMLPRQDENPFDSTRKVMSVLIKNEQGQYFVFAKGAPDVLLERCTHMQVDGKIVPMSTSLLKATQQSIEMMASHALRNIGFAYRKLDDVGVWQTQAAEQQLVFVGLVGMIDPPRPEVLPAIQTCKKAGIRTVMITGDHQITAEAIARQLGILPKNGQVIDGKQLSAMDDAELEKRVDKIYVFARVSPEHKLRIVKALQNIGHVVAMTGDGVNDAPAIKASDIGISMGKGGTDVAKEASALILSDDNFATIVAAIEEGRSIYDNIRKFVRYLLASNVGEIITMFLAMLMGLPLPLLPIQILWVNLVTDGLPAIALGVDSAEDDIMQKPPRNVKESIFARGLGWKIISRGVMIGVMTLAVFWFTLQTDPTNLTKAQTMAFTTLVMAQLIHVFDCRSVDRGIFARNLFGNMWLVASVAVSIILMLVVMYVEPLQPVFKTVPLDFKDWMMVLTAAAIPTFALAANRAGRKAAKKSKVSFEW